MKISINEHDLNNMVMEAIKNILNEVNAFDAMDTAQDYLQNLRKRYGDDRDKLEKKKEQARGVQQDAVAKLNRGGSGRCIIAMKPWQISYRSAFGYEGYVTDNGVIGVVGDKNHRFDHLNIPNELKVSATDATILANWCNRYLKNDYAKQRLGDATTWTVRQKK